MELEDWQKGESGLPAAVPESQAILTCTDGISLSGKMFANKDSLGCLAVPHVSGWTVCIDGFEVPTTRANYGFIGFTVPAGAHEIEATYTVPHARLGIALSILGAICTIACSLWKPKKK